MAVFYLGGCGVNKKLLSTTLLVVLFVSLGLVGGIDFETVQASTSVSGIIGSNATWTKANSPYSLSGNVLVDNGVTLMIASGVTVDLNGYYIMVNGTLQAQGTSSDKITFDGEGSITFTQSSVSWNEQNGAGSIIENANLDSAYVGISSVSPKISHNSILRIAVGGSASVTHNTITAEITVTSEAESPVITHNTISGEFSVTSNAASPSDSILIAYNTINNGIAVTSGAGSTTISYNTISGEVSTNSESTVISHNTINGGVVVSGSSSAGGAATVTDNIITGAEIGVACSPGLASDTAVMISNNQITATNVGVNLSPSMTTSLYGGRNNVTIIGNTISGCNTAGILVGEDSVQAGHTAHGNIARIEKNTISNNHYGIKSLAQSSIEGNLITNNYYGVWGGSLIQNNTITDNEYGILGGIGTLTYNNIHSNSEYSVHLGSTDLGFFQTSNLNATYNWWGTTDTFTIAESIYDYKEDFNLGKVNFEPFLTEPNPQATPDTFISETAYTPSPSPSPSPSPTPSLTPTATPTPTPTPSPTPSQEPSQEILFEAIIGAAIVVAVIGVGLGSLIFLIKRK
jgi:hypothetical protein